MNAYDLMTPNPVTVPPEASVAEAWDLMREMEIRHVPVVDDGTLVGMLSDRDIAHFDFARLLANDRTNALGPELATRVVAVMSSNVICVEPEAGMSEVIELLLEHKIGAIPVVRPDTRDLLGIVSYVDVLRALRDELEEA